MSAMLSSIRGRGRDGSTWSVKVYVRNAESLPVKYTRLKIEFRESKGRKISVSDEISAKDGQILLPHAKPLLIWQSFCTLFEESVQSDAASPTIQESFSLSESSSTQPNYTQTTSMKSKFFRLSLLRINPHAVRQRQKCIGSTIIDLAQYASYNATRKESVTLLIAVFNHCPAKVELTIQTTWTGYDDPLHIARSETSEIRAASPRNLIPGAAAEKTEVDDDNHILSSSATQSSPFSSPPATKVAALKTTPDTETQAHEIESLQSHHDSLSRRSGLVGLHNGR